MLKSDSSSAWQSPKAIDPEARISTNVPRSGNSLGRQQAHLPYSRRLLAATCAGPGWPLASERQDARQLGSALAVNGPKKNDAHGKRVRCGARSVDGIHADLRSIAHRLITVSKSSLDGRIPSRLTRAIPVIGLECSHLSACLPSATALAMAATN